MKAGYIGQSEIAKIDENKRLGDIGDMITPAQCRAARGLLGWSQQHLAERAQVGVVTIRGLETEAAEPRRATLFAIRHAFEAAGVEFIGDDAGGQGVRLGKASEPEKSTVDGPASSSDRPPSRGPR